MKRMTSILLAPLLGACQATSGSPDAALPPISPNRPTFSDGTSLIPVGHAQIEIGYTFTQRSQGGTDSDRNNLGELTARYRVSESVEARLLWGGYSWSSVDQGGSSSSDEGGTDAAIAVLVPVAEQDG